MKLKHIKVSPTGQYDSPFIGVILNSCKSKKQGKIINLNKEVLGYDGVVINGDWQLRMLDFVEVLKVVHEDELEFMLYTELSMDEFNLELGLLSYNHTRDTNLTMKNLEEQDKPTIRFMGSKLMSYYLSHTKFYMQTREMGEDVLQIIELPKEDEDGEK